MNYKVLYRKYRPDNFDSLIGQNHVIDILQNSIKNNKIAHAYLFSGPRGTGKTSTARILAKAINCLDNKDGLACCNCDNCLSFNTNPDIIEIDAASNNGVDEIRELINNVKIMPTSLKYKVYIIDEVHMLSQSAFNALLLTLEEPPEHVIFILATTNLESVPITIVSRCQKFDFKRISDEQITDRLKYICKSENIEYEDAGLQEIASLSDGGLRDALSVLDQLSKNNKIITSDLVSQELGSISNKKIKSLIKSLETNDIDNIELIFTDIKNTSLNYKVLIKKLIYELSDIGVSVLKGNNNYHICFDLCKNLIIDLNNLINSINLNVDAYLLIKMTFLNYIKYDEDAKIKQNSNTEIAKDTDITIKTNTKVDNKTTKKKNEEKLINQNYENEFINIRINNCFAGASKSYLNEVKEKWDDFIKNVNDSQLMGLLSDTTVVTASNNYAIIISSIKHKDIEINKKLEDIEKLFLSGKYNLVFISEERWNEEKNKYINNLKNNYKYEYIPENKSIKKEQLNDDNISVLSEVFDMNKIEIE